MKGSEVEERKEAEGGRAEVEVEVEEDDEAVRLREETELEERRRRRAAIMAKHQPPPLPPDPLASPPLPSPPSPVSASTSSLAHVIPTLTAPLKEESTRLNDPTSDPATAALPSFTIPAASALSSPLTLSPPSLPAPIPAPPPLAAPPSHADDFDMFSDSPSALLPPPSRSRPTSHSTPSPSQSALELLDSWDDVEGYYKYRAGDVLTDSIAHRTYRVCGLQGSGVFSTVLRVKEEGGGGTGVEKAGELVVKVIRNNETMYKAGLKEVAFLTRISQATSALPPHHRPHILQLHSHFHHRNHLCLVFPPYAMDLRRVIKKYGSVGLSLPAVRMFGHQLLIGLRTLRQVGVVHGDLKPDNLLVSNDMTDIAVCDFGSASMATECEVTPYLVSRFYRAPEVILGCTYDTGIDLWAVGCVLYELYTGQILLNGASNNDMLYQIIRLKGPIHPKMLRRATFAGQHFSPQGEFMLDREDVAGKRYRQVVGPGVAGSRDLLGVMKGYRGEGEGKDEAGMRKLKQLCDLIHQCTVVDPLKRPTVDALLKHPFIRED